MANPVGWTALAPHVLTGLYGVQKLCAGQEEMVLPLILSGFGISLSGVMSISIISSYRRVRDSMENKKSSRIGKTGFDPMAPAAI